MSDNLNAIQAFIKAQQEMSSPVFNSVNPHFKNKFADLKAVTDACLTALLDNNLTPVQSYGFENDLWGIKTVIMYQDLTEVGAGGFYPISSSLNDQQKGSASTYGKRYSLSMACNLVADEDDDGNAASEKPKKKAWRGPLIKTKFTKVYQGFIEEIANASCTDDLDQMKVRKDFQDFKMQALEDDRACIMGDGKEGKGMAKIFQERMDQLKAEDQMKGNQ